MRRCERSGRTSRSRRHCTICSLGANRHPRRRKRHPRGRQLKRTEATCTQTPAAGFRAPQVAGMAAEAEEAEAAEAAEGRQIGSAGGSRA